MTHFVLKIIMNKLHHLLLDLEKVAPVTNYRLMEREIFPLRLTVLPETYLQSLRNNLVPLYFTFNIKSENDWFINQ